MRDEIIEELWTIRDSLAKAANYDVREVGRRLMERQRGNPPTTAGAKSVDKPLTVDPASCTARASDTALNP